MSYLFSNCREAAHLPVKLPTSKYEITYRRTGNTRDVLLFLNTRILSHNQKNFEILRDFDVYVWDITIQDSIIHKKLGKFYSIFKMIPLKASITVFDEKVCPSIIKTHLLNDNILRIYIIDDSPEFLESIYEGLKSHKSRYKIIYMHYQNYNTICPKFAHNVRSLDEINF